MDGMVRRLGGAVGLCLGISCAAHRPPEGAGGFGVDANLRRAGIPPAAKDVLTTFAADVDPELRGGALAVAVRADREAGGGGWGTAGLWDPDPWVQAQVVAALTSRLDETRTVDLLSELAARPGVEPYTRCRAARFVPAPVPPAVREATTQGWQSAPLWKAAPCALTASVWGDGEATDRVAQAVAEGSVALDEAFLQDLASQDEPELVRALKAGLEQADELLRPAYARALLAHGESAGLDAFRSDLADADPLVRMEAVLLLTDAPPAADPLLGRAAQQQGTPEGEVASIAVAARKAGSLKSFERAVLSPNRDVRAASVAQLGQWAERMESEGRELPERRLEKLLAAAVVDPEIAVQRAAVEQIGRLGIVGLDPVVQALLKDDEAEPLVRIAAAEAAIRLRDAPSPLGGS